MLPQDLRAAGLCVRGAKQWFRLNGLDFNDFLRAGMPIEQAEAIDDALARKVVTATRERIEEEKDRP